MIKFDTARWIEQLIWGMRVIIKYVSYFDINI